MFSWKQASFSMDPTTAAYVPQTASSAFAGFAAAAAAHNKLVVIIIVKINM